VQIKAVACALLISLASSAALAQTPPPAPPGAPPAPAPAAGLPAAKISAIVRAAGFVPTEPPARVGNAYVVRASDPYGRPMRIAVDARSGAILSVRPMAAMRPWGYGPPDGYYAGYGPYRYGPYQRYPGPGPVPRGPYDDEVAQPWPGPGGPAYPGAPAMRPNPDQKSAAVTPANPPLPRPKPAAKPAAVKPASPQETTPPAAGQTATTRPAELPPETTATTPTPGSAPVPAAPAAPASPPINPLE
jgi:hypothetical protein